MGLEKFEMSDVNSLTALRPPYMGICHFLVGTLPLPPSWVTHFLAGFYMMGILVVKELNSWIKCSTSD